MNKFKIGDRVFCLGNNEYGSKVKFEIGTVCGYYSVFCKIVRVRWDEESIWKHDCAGNCDIHHGWNVEESDLQLIEDNSQEDFNMEELL